MSKLQPLENTVVHLPTREEYDEYMKLCEEAGWNWFSRNRPTFLQYWREHKDQTCVEVHDSFCYGSLMGHRNDTILTFSELKAKFGIGQKPAPEVWQIHYTKAGHTLHRDHIILADGTKYTVEELSNRANLLLSLSRAHRKFFPK